MTDKLIELSDPHRADYLVAALEGAQEEIAVLQKKLALVEYILQDDFHNRLTPRVGDIAYSAFMRGRTGKNPEDGGPCDWFTDTKPMVDEAIAQIRKDLDKYDEDKGAL